MVTKQEVEELVTQCVWTEMSRLQRPLNELAQDSREALGGDNSSLRRAVGEQKMALARQVSQADSPGDGRQGKRQGRQC